MELDRMRVVQALKYRRVFRGHSCKGEPIEKLSEETASLVNEFLLDWKDDAVVAVALSCGQLQATTILSLINAGIVRREELEDAFRNLLQCIGGMSSPLADEPYWITLKDRARELSCSQDEDGWYVFTKVKKLLEHSEHADAHSSSS